jgi:hypothetical protein
LLPHEPDGFLAGKHHGVGEALDQRASAEPVVTVAVRDEDVL